MTRKSKSTGPRLRALLKRHGLGAIVWRRRAAFLGGAIVVGLIALLFARLADEAGTLFLELLKRWPLAPLVVTPVGFVIVEWLTRCLAPAATGSGIPQVMAATRDPENGMSRLLSARTVVVKFVLTISTLLFGASVGREGPTVQIAAWCCQKDGRA